MVYLHWSCDAKVPGCLGFTVHRINVTSGKSKPLPTWVGFEADPNKKHEMRDSDVWPIQKFQWKDVTARRGGHYRYRIIPMIGEPGALAPNLAMAQETNEVKLAPKHGPVSVFFNRGIISTQAIAALLPKKDGKPDQEALRHLISEPTAEARERLAGDLDEAIPTLFERARQEGGECYCALYELNDPELLQALLAFEPVHVILSNTGEDDGTNTKSRRKLHQAGKDVTDRMLAEGHIGHNKFVVWVDGQGVPKAVLTGSTNWTSTGLCSQTNNAIIVESEPLARQYLAYWNALRADNAAQGAAFRAGNRQVLPATDLGPDQGTIRPWFSPNTAQEHKPSNNPGTPADLSEVFDLLWSAQKGVLFLAFIPGRPSIVTELKKVYAAKVDHGEQLFVRGAATDESAAEEFKVDLFHRSAWAGASVTSVAGIKDAFSYWQQELYKLGFAVIHDKIVVVDPFTDNCAVVTGSHNLGFKASYQNDENLLILRGNRAAAEAYAAHVLDVYDHFRWRWYLQQAQKKDQEQQAWQDLDETDHWQDKYFKPGSLASADVKFWQ
jgi:phosphatidylserine/phosphatidylglycerophosphate/cardiolipin synthase-like enzyme